MLPASVQWLVLLLVGHLVPPRLRRHRDGRCFGFALKLSVRPRRDRTQLGNEILRAEPPL